MKLCSWTVFAFQSQVQIRHRSVEYHKVILMVLLIQLGVAHLLQKADHAQLLNHNFLEFIPNEKKQNTCNQICLLNKPNANVRKILPLICKLFLSSRNINQSDALEDWAVLVLRLCIGSVLR